MSSVIDNLTVQLLTYSVLVHVHTCMYACNLGSLHIPHQYSFLPPHTFPLPLPFPPCPFPLPLPSLTPLTPFPPSSPFPSPLTSITPSPSSHLLPLTPLISFLHPLPFPSPHTRTSAPPSSHTPTRWTLQFTLTLLASTVSMCPSLRGCTTTRPTTAVWGSYARLY